MKFTVAKKAIALTGAVAMLGSVAACGSDTASGKPAQDKDVTEITVWAWEPTLTQVAKDFTKKTGIKVDLKNVGTNTKEYTQLDNAIEAGSGAPDVAQVEYYAIPQYAIKGNLLDITDKTSGYSDFYTLARGLPCSSPARSTACRWIPAQWPSSTTRRSSTRPVLTPSRSRPGISTTTPPRRFTLWATTTTSPPTPVTPASSTP